jgi:hypothetical protein
LPIRKAKKPNVERLLDEAGEDVLLGGPEQRRDRHVDDDQRGGQERHLAVEQAEARVDIDREGVEDWSMSPVFIRASLMEHLDGLG